MAPATAREAAGFAILWMVIFGCIVTVAVQIELARWTTRAVTTAA